MKIKMLVTDFDGTLLASNKKLSQRALTLAERCQRAGVIFTIATGRMYRTISPHAKTLGITAPIIVHNGASCRVLEGETIFEQLIPAEVMAEIIATFRRNNWPVITYKDNDMLMSTPHPVAEWYEQQAGTGPKFIGDKFWQPDSVLKIASIVFDDTINDMRELINNKFSDKVYAVFTPPYFQIMQKKVNKGNAVLKLAEYYKIDPSEILAFGDEDNDLEMLSTVGHGYAMANALPSLLEKVKCVAPSNDEDGVVQVAERLIAGL